MYRRVALHLPVESNRIRGGIRQQGCLPTSPRVFMAVAPEARQMSTDTSPIVPNMKAPNLGWAQELGHVRSVSKMLHQQGILKISLGFEDSKSQYLEQLLLTLHQQHRHKLPIAHSATKGWFWDCASHHYELSDRQLPSSLRDNG